MAPHWITHLADLSRRSHAQLEGSPCPPPHVVRTRLHVPQARARHRAPSWAISRTICNVITLIWGTTKTSLLSLANLIELAKHQDNLFTLAEVNKDIYVAGFLGKGSLE